MVQPITGLLATETRSIEPDYFVRWGEIEEKNGVKYPLGWSIQAHFFEVDYSSLSFIFPTSSIKYNQDHFMNGIKLAIYKGFPYYFKVEHLGQEIPCVGRYRCAAVCYVGEEKMRLMFKRFEPAWGYFSPPNTVTG